MRSLTTKPLPSISQTSSCLAVPASSISTMRLPRVTTPAAALPGDCSDRSTAAPLQSSAASAGAERVPAAPPTRPTGGRLRTYRPIRPRRDLLRCRIRRIYARAARADHRSLPCPPLDRRPCHRAARGLLTCLRKWRSCNAGGAGVCLRDAGAAGDRRLGRELRRQCFCGMLGAYRAHLWSNRRTIDPIVFLELRRSCEAIRSTLLLRADSGTGPSALA